MNVRGNAELDARNLCNSQPKFPVLRGTLLLFHELTKGCVHARQETYMPSNCLMRTVNQQ